MDLGLSNVNRSNALYNLITNIYNDNRSTGVLYVPTDLYLQDVIDCTIIIKNDDFDYLYSKPYRFKSTKLSELSNYDINDILFEDSAYIESFEYIKRIIEDNCNLESCYEVWKRTRVLLSHIQERFNNSLTCSIIHGDNKVIEIPYPVDIESFISLSEVNTIVFMKSLIAFLQRGRWHLKYIDAQDLPEIRNEYNKVIPQSGTYPVAWFNDSDDIDAKLDIWPAKSQYILYLTWKSVSDFCSHVYGDINVGNKYNYSDNPIYLELDKVFESVKAQCPVSIRKDPHPVDFDELERIARIGIESFN